MKLERINCCPKPFAYELLTCLAVQEYQQLEGLHDLLLTQRALPRNGDDRNSYLRR